MTCLQKYLGEKELVSGLNALCHLANKHSEYVRKVKATKKMTVKNHVAMKPSSKQVKLIDLPADFNPPATRTRHTPRVGNQVPRAIASPRVT